MSMRVSSGSCIVSLACIGALLSVREETLDEVVDCGSTDRWTMRETNLGAGAYGAVRQVVNARGEEYAIKSVHSAASKSELQNEIAALSNFDGCPGVVQMKDERPCDATGQRINDAYVMNLYQQDLEKYMQSNSNCFGYIFIEVVQAIVCMHSRHWIHADIKPKNVFLNIPLSTGAKCSDPGWQVGVGDFGLSLRIGSQGDQFPGNASNYSYLHPWMFGKSTFLAEEQVDWYSVFVLYCDLLEKLVKRATNLNSLSKDRLKFVAQSKGFTEFDHVWDNVLKMESTDGRSDCFKKSRS